MFKQNLELSHADGEDADGGGQYEEGDALVKDIGIWAIGFHRKGDKCQDVHPLDAKLAPGLSVALLNSHIVSCDMVWAKEC